jgi:hypothetical protein
VKVHPQTVVPRSGARPEHFDGGRRHKTFWLVQVDGGWRTTRLDQPE